MPSTFALAPIPFWVILEANGKPAANCIMYPRSSLDHQVVKNVFQDPGGMIPYPLNSDGGIVFRENGTKGPFYWEDTGVANDLYYLEFWSQDGNLIDAIDHYPIAGGGGGGPPVTVLSDLENSIIDGQFSFHVLGTGISPIPNGMTEIQAISPFDPLINTPIEGGWFFIKNMTGNNDALSVIQASLSGTTPDSNPRGFLTYNCIVAGTGDHCDATYITADVKTFQNEQVMFQFQSQATGGAPIGVSSEVVITQNFGTGGAPSPTVETTFPFVWTNGTYGAVTLSIVVPSTGGKARGTNNDDYFAIAVRMPIGVTGIYQITNVMLVRGTVIPPTYLYETQAETFYKVSNSFDSGFRTGDIKSSFEYEDHSGWLRMQTGVTIGNTGSGASYTGLAYRNLYIFWWNRYTNTAFPVSGGRGVSALSDFNANKVMTQASSTDMVAVNAFGSAFFVAAIPHGSKTHTLTVAELASHNHTVSVQGSPGPPTSTITTGGPQNWNPNSNAYTTSNTGSNTPFEIIQPSLPMFFFVKL